MRVTWSNSMSGNYDTAVKLTCVEDPAYDTDRVVVAAGGTSYDFIVNGTASANRYRFQAQLSYVPGGQTVFSSVVASRP
jgi:hypothetical protein